MLSVWIYSVPELTQTGQYRVDQLEVGDSFTQVLVSSHVFLLQTRSTDV